MKVEKSLLSGTWKFRCISICIGFDNLVVILQNCNLSFNQSNCLEWIQPVSRILGKYQIVDLCSAICAIHVALDSFITLCFATLCPSSGHVGVNRMLEYSTVECMYYYNLNIELCTIAHSLFIYEHLCIFMLYIYFCSENLLVF